MCVVCVGQLCEAAFTDYGPGRELVVQLAAVVECNLVQFVYIAGSGV